MAENRLVLEVCFYTPRSGSLGVIKEHCMVCLRAFTGTIIHIRTQSTRSLAYNVDNCCKDDHVEALVREVTLSPKTN